MLLNKTKCLCGKELLDETFSNYVPNKDREFYGGRVSMIATHNCECGRKLKGFFEVNALGELKLIDLEEIDEIKEQEKTDDNCIEKEIKNDLTETSCEEQEVKTATKPKNKNKAN